MGNHSSKTQSKKSKKKFKHFYDLGQAIGSGTYATVFQCWRKSDSSEFAVKIINKKYLTNRELIGLEQEVEILQQVSHENIIKLIDVFDDIKRHKVYLVLELCDGVDLFDQIVYAKKNRLSEKQSAKIVYNLCNALEYLHDNGIVHRDIKCENILMNCDGTPRITDFGLAFSQCYINGANAMLTDHSSDSSTLSTSSISSVTMSTCCGTPNYVAPEIIAGNFYDSKCDMWSLGVILFVMLSGCQPFTADSLKHIYDAIVKGKYSFRNKRWNKISNEAKDLVKCLLNTDPRDRYS
eukprot:13930_1